MKKITFIIAIAGLFAFASCNKEFNPVSTDIKPVTGGINICGSYAQYDDSKTLLEADGKSIKWGNQHDSTEFVLVTHDFKSLINQADSCYHNQLCDSLGRSADQKTAYFKAVNSWHEDIRQINPGARFIALSPYCATGGNSTFYPNKEAGSTVIFFPSYQRAVASGLPLNLDPYKSNTSSIPSRGNSANVMTAYTTMDADRNVNFQFKNVGALLKISLTGESANLSALDRIRIQAVKAGTTVSLAGKPKGTVGTDGIYTLANQFSTRKDTVTLAEPEGGWAAATYYACVLPTETDKLAKLSVTFIYKNGSEITKTNETTKAIVRNQIYNLGSFAVAAAPTPQLPTHTYQFWCYDKNSAGNGLGAGSHSLVDGSEPSTQTYFTVGTWEANTNTCWAKFGEEGKYSCKVKRNLSFVYMPKGSYRSKSLDSANDSLKCNTAYKIQVAGSGDKFRDCHMGFTTSSLVNSKAIIYHIRKVQGETWASIALVGKNSLNEVVDSVSFSSDWDDYTKSEYALKKGVTYTLKNSSKKGETDALNTEVTLLSLTIEESN